MREAAADDHFYGPWKGGPKGSGGRPAGGEAPATKVTNVVDPAFDFKGLTDQQLDALLPNAEYHAQYSRTGTPIGDRWQQVVRQTKAEIARRKLREAGDDHFYGPWKGDAKAAGGRPEKPSEARPEKPSLQTQAWQDPPPKEAGPGGVKKAGGYSSDEAYGTNTALGRAGEKSFVNVVGGEVLHAPGKGEQSPLDVKVGQYGFEVKAVSTRSTKYAATPKKYEVAQKEAYAKKMGLKPAMAIVVMDAKSGQAHVYYREGLRGGRLSKATGWKYLGSGDAAKIAEAFGLVEAGDDHFYGAWSGGSKAQGGRPMRASGSADPTLALRDKVALELARGPQDHETCVAVRDGEEVFRKSGGGREVSFTEAEANLMKDAHVVHNHPSGTAPSIADYSMASRYADAASMTAIGTTVQGDQWKYTITRPKNGWGRGTDIYWPYHEEKVSDRVAQASWRVSKEASQRMVINERHEVWLEMAARFPTEIIYSREAWS